MVNSNAAVKVIKCFNAVRRTRPDMPVQQAQMLLLIAMSEGITLTELIPHLGTTQQAVSRNAKYLSKYAGPNNTVKGLDLITMAPHFEMRSRLACYLTEKGKQLVNEMLKPFEEN